jgi:hypothetical protein
MRRLKIYNDQNHPHQAQNPIEIDISNFYIQIHNLMLLIQILVINIRFQLEKIKFNKKNNYNNFKFMNSKMN